MIEVKESWDGDQANDSMSDETNLIVEGTGVRIFTVLFDDSEPQHNAAAALRAKDSVTGVQVPVMYEQYPGEPWLFVIDRQANRIQPLFSRVTINYKSLDDPLQQPPIWSLDSQVTDEPIDRDYSNNPLTNSSDEPFDPPTTRPVYDLVFRYQRNEESYNLLTVADFQDSINGGVFLGFPAHHVKCVKIAGQQARAANTIYYVVNYEFVIRVDATDTWIRRFIDEGFRTKAIGSDGEAEYTSIKDVEGKPITSPVLLDGTGQKLETGNSPVFLTYDLVKERDFSLLNIVLV